MKGNRINKLAELRNELYRLNDLYRKGTPEVSDTEYDALVEYLRKQNPEDEFFTKGIVEKATDRMEPLPLPMYSLEKVKTYKELKKWLKKVYDLGARDICITPKFDGISLLVNEQTEQAWTRGDGVEGQRSDVHYHSLVDNDHCDIEFEKPYYTWGEAIFRRADFDTVKENGAEYKNARNAVAGLFNSPDGTNPALQYVSYVRYGSDLKMSKMEQLATMKEQGFTVAPNFGMYIDEILDTVETPEDDEEYTDADMEKEFDAWFEDWNKTWNCDGLVFEVDEYEIREKLGRLPNGNPAYAIAFKKPEWVPGYLTTVKNIEANISKDGVWCPVIVVEPVEMDGATVERVTGYNAQYIVDNHIHPGAEIEITRSGQVIPKHIRTVKWDAYKFDTWFVENAYYCPSCGRLMQYDENGVNLVCQEEGCEQRVISGIVYFFKTLGVEGFSEPTIRTLYKEGYDTLDKVLGATIPALQRIFGQVRGMNVFTAISKSIAEEQPLSRIMTALNCFRGVIAESVAEKIISNTGDPRPYFASRTLEQAERELSQIEGVGEQSINAFCDGCKRYDDYRRNNPEFPYTVTITVKKQPVQVADNQLVVCMTGFRDKELEQRLESQGHRVVSGVTRDCNVLVVADLSSQSSKSQKAREKGIRIVDRETFNKEINDR